MPVTARAPVRGKALGNAFHLQLKANKAARAASRKVAAASAAGGGGSGSAKAKAGKGAAGKASSAKVKTEAMEEDEPAAAAGAGSVKTEKKKKRSGANNQYSQMAEIFGDAFLNWNNPVATTSYVL
jgi:hypothetical protein